MKHILLTVIIPTLNEEGNIGQLMKRLDTSLKNSNITYTAMVIDDHSTDQTWETLKQFEKKYPITMYRKQGQPGKAFSLLEGFAQTDTPLIAMIDADLQYPPEAIASMVRKIQANTADIVVADRVKTKPSPQQSDSSLFNQVTGLRRLASKTFRIFFGHWMHGIEADVQSGLKVFKRELIQRIDVNPTPWTFDLEFLLKAKQAGYRIGSVPIVFSPRAEGQAKVRLLKTSVEIAKSALKLKFASHQRIPLLKENQVAHDHGFHYNGNKYHHYSALPHHESALQQLNSKQLIWVGLGIALVISLFVINWYWSTIALVSLLAAFYFSDLVFNSYLMYRSFSQNPEIKISNREIKAYAGEWPSYTILCPLYKEWQVLPQFVKAMQKLDYPKDKLQVMLLLEENDKPTIKAAKEFDLPDYFQITVVPHSMPKTKPKACNYGLLKATGEFVVIYDAEDKPEAKQLKKAILAFAKANSRTTCVQAKLNYYNWNQNWLTRLFTAEYSLWFDLILPGLQSINAPIPLGGTSNHFKTDRLRQLHAWDPFNVTEDCDLGMRIVKRGYRTAIVDSTTWEEANSEPYNWYRQRSRWIKGYIQTYFVHMRDLWAMTHGWKHWENLVFQLTVGGKILSLLINPLMWLLTASYFIFTPYLKPIMDQIYLTPILYIGVFSALFGNFIYLYAYALASAKRKRYSLIKYTMLIPIYWLGMSIAAMRAAYEVVVKPHYWAKTQHGLHLKTKKTKSIKRFIPAIRLGRWQLAG